MNKVVLVSAAIAVVGLTAGWFLFVKRKKTQARETTLECSADFNEAVAAVKTLNISDTSILLRLYGLYKRATVGITEGNAPWEPTARAKWNAWHDCRDLSKDEAETLYVDMVQKLRSSKPEGTPTKKPSMGPKVSKMLMPVEANESQADDTSFLLYNKVKSDFSCLCEALEDDSMLPKKCDEDGRTLLHWAVDGNNLDATVILVERGAELNAKDIDGYTPLGYAASENLTEIASYLVQAGADIDTAGPDESAIDMTNDADLKLLFKSKTPK